MIWEYVCLHRFWRKPWGCMGQHLVHQSVHRQRELLSVGTMFQEGLSYRYMLYSATQSTMTILDFTCSCPQVWCAECRNTLMIQTLLTQADLIQRIKSNSSVIYMYIAMLVRFLFCIGQIHSSTFHLDWAIVPALESTLQWYDSLSMLINIVCCTLTKEGLGDKAISTCM